MIKPVRLQLRRSCGFNLRALSLATNGLPAINVARPGKWGNPYCVGRPVDKAQVRRWGWKFRDLAFVTPDAHIAKRHFGYCVWSDEALHEHVRSSLGNKNLACWCGLCPKHQATGKPFDYACTDCAPCHADPLGLLANTLRCEDIEAIP